MVQESPLDYHLAQYNLARLVAPLDDPLNADFVAALDRVNQLGDRSPGFVWRHQTAEGNSTSIRVRGDPLIVINFSVWEDAESLFEYTYRSEHAEVYRRRRDWFERPLRRTSSSGGSPPVMSRPSTKQRSGWITCGRTGRRRRRSPSSSASRDRPSRRSGAVERQGRSLRLDLRPVPS